MEKLGLKRLCVSPKFPLLAEKTTRGHALAIAVREHPRPSLSPVPVAIRKQEHGVVNQVFNQGNTGIERAQCMFNQGELTDP